MVYIRIFHFFYCNKHNRHYLSYDSIDKFCIFQRNFHLPCSAPLNPFYFSSYLLAFRSLFSYIISVKSLRCNRKTTILSHTLYLIINDFDPSNLSVHHCMLYLQQSAYRCVQSQSFQKLQVYHYLQDKH